jgi:two-component system, chemotaxis family, chemotaxis protein CheY
MQENESRLATKNGEPVRYLVVDDSVFARKFLAKMLVEMTGGIIAGEAGNGVTAVEEYNKLRPDIVLMDVTMPEMEGMEAAEKILRGHPQAKIVMVSSVGDHQNIADALRIGVLHFVQKPAKAEPLYAVIKSVLNGEEGAAGSTKESRLP